MSNSAIEGLSGLRGRLRRFAVLISTVRRIRMSMALARLGLSLLGFRKVRSNYTEFKKEIGGWGDSVPRKSSRVQGSTFVFNNVAGSYEEIGWFDSRRDALWRFNQHYFAHLTSEDASDFLRDDLGMLEAWIHENPIGTLPAWHPYPTSIRLVNLIKWNMNQSCLSTDWIDLLGLHAEYVSKNLETHLLGNHLLTNLKALIFASVVLVHPNSARWGRKASLLLRRELREQVLEDGAHAELSPMYHSLILEDLIEIARICRVSIESDVRMLGVEVERKLPAMLAWLGKMQHGQAILAHFNDTAQGVGVGEETLLGYASGLELGDLKNRTSSSPGEGPVAEFMGASGFLVASYEGEESSSKLIFDVGEIGLHYLPGHGHADALSIELSIDSLLVIRNGGVTTYHDLARRKFERSTMNQSTVTLDGENSSEVWDKFRVGRSAKSEMRIFESDEGTVRAIAAHDGYRAGWRKNPHVREIRYSKNSLNVADRIEVPEGDMAARFILGVGCKASSTDSDRFSVALKDSQVWFVVKAGQASLTRVTVSDGFGIQRETAVLVIAAVDGRTELNVGW